MDSSRADPVILADLEIRHRRRLRLADGGHGWITLTFAGPQGGILGSFSCPASDAGFLAGMLAGGAPLPAGKDRDLVAVRLGAASLLLFRDLNARGRHLAYAAAECDERDLDALAAALAA